MKAFVKPCMKCNTEWWMNSQGQMDKYAGKIIDVKKSMTRSYTQVIGGVWSWAPHSLVIITPENKEKYEKITGGKIELTD